MSDRHLRARYGLTPSQLDGVRPALLSMARQIDAWERQVHPLRAQFWALDDARRSLNELAESLTGEPLWRRR